MPVTTRTPAPRSLLQKFRATTEGLVVQAAQEEMLRQYPNTGRRPARYSGWSYTLLRLLVLPGYRLTPWSLRQRLMRLFFVRGPQHWKPVARPKQEQE